MRPAFLTLALLSALAHADSLSSLPDPAYAEPRTRQRDPLQPKIHQIIYPVLGLPTLTNAPGTFDIWLRDAPAGAAPDRPADWKIILHTDGTPEEGPWLELAPSRIDRDPAGGLVKLHVDVPASCPRETFDLKVFGPGNLVDGQPRAVRVLGPPRTNYRFALMSDHQLWDPSWAVGTNEKNAGDYPTRGEKDRNRAAARQGWHELELLDPDFVIYGGDLVFGLDYPTEDGEMYRLWSQNRFATFMVPGNHDGYSRYEVRIKGTLAALGIGIFRCKKLLDGPLDRFKVWGFVSCAYQDVRKNLWENLVADGLTYYRTMFGPPFYSFDAGKLHFIALNTYSGTPERRHSYSFYVDLFDLHLGAPAVDNYGGYLTDAELDWLEEDAKRAHDAGQIVVVYGHHDPRGNREAAPNRRFHHDNPFPTDPISLEGFQEWNYDDSNWASDPGHPRKEGPLHHSGTRLLEILGKYSTYVMLGHRHADEHQVYLPGDELAPGIKAEHRMEFLRVTSAAGSPYNGAYWGYRMFDVRDDGVVDMGDFDATRHLLSIPEGNLWADTQGSAATVVNGLPKPMEVTLRMRLPHDPVGWRFTDAQTGKDLPLRQVAPLAGNAAMYYVAYTAPATEGDFPPKAGAEARHMIVAQAATGNRPPAAAIAVRPEHPAPGEAVTLVGSAVDPDGQQPIDWEWDLGPLGTARGPEAHVTFPQPGSYSIKLAAIDPLGARGDAAVEVVVAAPVVAQLPPPAQKAVVPPPKGCACAVGQRPRSPLAALPFAVVALAIALRRRRRS